MSAKNLIKRFQSAQGSIQLFAREGLPAVELLASNPLVGFCLALNDTFRNPPHHSPLSAASALMQRKQREILGWLGFQPATEAVAKLGRKCLPESLNIERCKNLRRAVADPDIRSMLAHLPRINAGVIALVATPTLRASVSPQLLNAVADSVDEVSQESTAELLRDTLEMYILLQRTDRPPRFFSHQRIREKHDDLVTEIIRHGTHRQIQGRFPRPPISGVYETDKQITPVCTMETLSALGREQHNCVGAYRDRILQGSVYIYRVCVNGEVCTLSLLKDGNNYYRLSELKAACNREPSTATQSAVRHWLERASDEPLV